MEKNCRYEKSWFSGDMENVSLGWVRFSHSLCHSTVSNGEEIRVGPGKSKALLNLMEYSMRVEASTCRRDRDRSVNTRIGLIGGFGTLISLITLLGEKNRFHCS